MEQVKTIKYGDRLSNLALWWKAVFLVPLWGVLVVPIIGGLAAAVGETVLHAMFLLTMAGFIGYFIEDLLKRRIAIDDKAIYWGFKCYRLADLSSVGLDYKSNKVVPASVIFNFSAGRQLKLKLNCLNSNDFDVLIKNIERRYKDCKIDPVIENLTRCKHTARHRLPFKGDKIELPYHSRRLIKGMAGSFVSTADSWSRIGPLLCSLLFAPVWAGFTAGLYLSMNWIGHYRVTTLPFSKAFYDMIGQTHGALADGVTAVTKTFVSWVEQPLVWLLLLVSLLPLSYYLVRNCFKPNWLSLDGEGMKLFLRLSLVYFPTDSIKWSEVKSARLIKPDQSSGPDKWKVRLERTGSNRPFDLELGALAEKDRYHLISSLEENAAESTVEAEFTETLLPRQEKSYTEIWLQSLSQPPERQNLDPLAPGDRLFEDRFEVVRRLGIGGQGMAYLCSDALGDGIQSYDMVVLKETIIPVFVDKTIRQQALERFEKEARTLEDLESDHIARLLDFFVEDHRGYLVLEHIEGRSLRQMVEEDGAVDEKKTVELARQMCDILEHIHSKSVIHRDFTPDNLILDKEGKLKLIDFNVAQQGEEGSTGTIVGKHAYVPPEQFRGKATYQSDIYAMGATLYYLLAGQDPEPITRSSPAGEGRKVSEKFSNLIENCTALNTAKRFQSIAEVSEHLTGVEVDSTMLDLEAAVEDAEASLVESDQLTLDLSISVPEKETT